VCWLLLAAAWTWARGRRRQALMERSQPIERPRKGEVAAASPAVSLVMPVKGVHCQSMDNWRSIVANEYGACSSCLPLPFPQGESAPSAASGQEGRGTEWLHLQRLTSTIHCRSIHIKH
jgi:hypothetical protein